MEKFGSKIEDVDEDKGLEAATYSLKSGWFGVEEG